MSTPSVGPHASPAGHLAHAERLRLCDTFDRVGPDVPTLCSPWSARDLAAHLVFRDGLLDVSLTRLRALVAGRATRAAYAAMDWPALVGTVRSGPPRLSPAGLSAVDEMMNTNEFFIHHEDVLRAAPGWTARALPSDLERALMKPLGIFGRLSFRSAPVGVVLAAPGAAPKMVKAPTDLGSVTVTGTPGELALYASGRARVALVELEGSAQATAALKAFGPQ